MSGLPVSHVGEKVSGGLSPPARPPCTSAAARSAWPTGCPPACRWWASRSTRCSAASCCRKRSISPWRRRTPSPSPVATCRATPYRPARPGLVAAGREHAPGTERRRLRAGRRPGPPDRLSCAGSRRPALFRQRGARLRRGGSSGGEAQAWRGRWAAVPAELQTQEGSVLVLSGHSYLHFQRCPDGIWRLQASFGRAGYRTEFRWSGRGLLTGVRDSAGRSYALVYQQACEPSEGDDGLRLFGVILASHDGPPPDYIDPQSPGLDWLVRYQFSDSGDLIAVRDRLGQVVRVFAWREHMLVAHGEPGGLEVRYEWDVHAPHGRVVKQIEAGGLTRTFRYLRDATEVSDSLGRVERYEFAGEGGQRRWTALVRPTAAVASSTTTCSAAWSPCAIRWDGDAAPARWPGADARGGVAGQGALSQARRRRDRAAGRAGGRDAAPLDLRARRTGQCDDGARPGRQHPLRLRRPAPARPADANRRPARRRAAPGVEPLRPVGRVDRLFRPGLALRLRQRRTFGRQQRPAGTTDPAPLRPAGATDRPGIGRRQRPEL